MMPKDEYNVGDNFGCSMMIIILNVLLHCWEKICKNSFVIFGDEVRWFWWHVVQWPKWHILGSIYIRMLWFRQIFESDFCQLGQDGELYLHEYFQKKNSKNSKTSWCKPFLCLPSIGTYSYKGRFLHFGDAAPGAHNIIPGQFPSHEAHLI